MKRRLKTSKQIGDKIKKRRKELGISQEKLAETIGVTYQQVQRYENGMNRLNVENVQVIAEALAVSVSYFFEDDKTPMISEVPFLYLPADESKLLRYFRKIRNKSTKNLVIQMVKLIGKGKP